jgi:hypothetical protein
MAKQIHEFSILTRARAHVRTYACTHVRMYARTHAYTHSHTHVPACAYNHVLRKGFSCSISSPAPLKPILLISFSRAILILSLFPIEVHLLNYTLILYASTAYMYGTPINIFPMQELCMCINYAIIT